MNKIICNLLDWYQIRIGSYDKQSWEKSLDAKFLKNNFYCLSKKSNKVENLIDIDLIKGSTFTKTKSKLSLMRVMFNGIKKLIFYPFYFKWWKYQTNTFFAFVLLFVYLLQISNMIVYNYNQHILIQNKKQLITFTEIVTPTLLMLILGIMYTYITSALPNKNDFENECEKKYVDMNIYRGAQLNTGNDSSLAKEKASNKSSNQISQKKREDSRRKHFIKSKSEEFSNQIDLECPRNADTLNSTDPQVEETCLRNRLNETNKSKLRVNFSSNDLASENTKKSIRDPQKNIELHNAIEKQEHVRNKMNNANKLVSSRFIYVPDKSDVSEDLKTSNDEYDNKNNEADVEEEEDETSYQVQDEDNNEDDFDDDLNNNTFSTSYSSPENSLKTTLNDDEEIEPFTSSTNCLNKLKTNEIYFSKKKITNICGNKKNKKTIDYYNKCYLDEEYYDLNEGELSDSDQTESCILNDQNNNDLVNYDEEKGLRSKSSSKNAVLQIKTSETEQEINDSSIKKKSYRSNSIGLNAVKEKISCIIWQTNEWKGADLSMLEISNSIIVNVNKASLSVDYFYVGIFFSILIGLLPIYYHNSERISVTNVTMQNKTEAAISLNGSYQSEILNFVEIISFNLPFRHICCFIIESLNFWISIDLRASFIIFNTLVSTIILCMLFFSLLTIAERTLNQRFLHAKYFCYLTSNRRARKHNLPHFRLGKVENIKTWLSVRSYMKRRGPQRSIDAIISSTFLIGVGLCSVVCIRFLQDADFLSESLFNWQLVVWCLCIWTFMLRFMTIGFKINKKYRNCMSMVITEQINLYLQMEKTPEKKDELTCVNNVLKLASDLLKEIENPFKISGLGVDPWVYNITKVVILSAFSAVLSELFGFKLKLYKIKIN